MTKPSVPKRRITFERIYDASIDRVWDLWTTKSGIESWWGPEGFSVEVLKLDLRTGGELRYAMSAVAPEMIAFMKSEGVPTTTESLITFTEVDVHKHLIYTHLTDFILGVDPYDVATEVEFHTEGNRVRMCLTMDAMHNDEWTRRATMGWESELGKLQKVLQTMEAST